MRELLVRFLARVGSPATAAVLVLVSTLAFHKEASQSPVWLAPYLSGAANGAPGQAWMVDPASVDEMMRLDDDGRWSHRFEPAVDRGKLVEFKSMDVGWMWVVWFARKLMPFWGDLCAVSVLTVILHHGLAAMVFRHLTSPVARGTFVLLYVANPLVIHVVSMPYYYGWQAVATLVAINMVFAAHRMSGSWQLPATAMLLLCSAIRPNVLTIAAPAVVWSAYLLRRRSAWISVAVFVVGALAMPKVNKPFWHTVYSGLGAYPNRHGLYLSDDSSAAAYSKATGEAPYTARIGGTFHDPEFRRRFSSKLQELALEVVKDDPALPLRNATLNSLIVFAWVYKPGMPYWLYLAQAALGLAALVFLLRAWRVTWAPLVALGLVVGPIVPYHPPIAVYVVGGYSALALAWAYALSDKLGCAKQGLPWPSAPSASRP